MLYIENQVIARRGNALVRQQLRKGVKTSLYRLKAEISHI